MRSLIRLAPLVLGLFAAAPAFANINSSIVVQSVSLGVATENVLLRVDIVRVGGDCPTAGDTWCVSDRVKLRIVPTPPGLPTTNGGYETTYFPDITPTRSFILTRGTTYTFTAHVRRDIGKPAAGGSCNVQCIWENDADAVTYASTPVLAPPTWAVTADHVDGNVLWVKIDLVGANLTNTPCVLSGVCGTQERTYGAITPCALDMTGTLYYNECQEGKFYFETLTGATVLAALEIGQVYTLTGGHSQQGFRAESHGACVEPFCTFDEKTATITVPTTPLATRPVTWGAVKSMYRTP